MKKGMKDITLNWGIKKLYWKILFNIENFILIPLEIILLYPLTNLLNAYFIKRIINHYGADYKCNNQASQNLDKNNNNLGYGLLYYSFIRNIRPERVLCIGSMYGFIPFICALACKHNKKGIVDFVDAGYDQNNPNDKGKHSFGQGFWKKINSKQHFNFLEVNKYINIYVMKSKDYAEKFPKRNYEFIYIDGDHSYKGAHLDYKLFWLRLIKNGFIVFHDTDNKGMYGNIYYDVSKLWQELTKKHQQYFHLPNKESGLGIIQKLK